MSAREHVPRTAYRVNQVLFVRFIDLGAKPADVYVDDISPTIKFRVPDVIRNGRVIQHLPAPAGKERKQRELLRGQIKLHASALHSLTDQVDFQVCDTECLVAERAAAGCSSQGAAEDCPDAPPTPPRKLA